MLQQRDHNMLPDDVCMVTPLQELEQSVYLSHGSTAYYLYILGTHGELHQQSLSTSTLVIFMTDFSHKNGITTTIRTKLLPRTNFLIQFGTKLTPLPESSYRIQYSFESMFI